MKFWLSPYRGAIRIESDGRSYVGYLRHDNLSGQDSLWFAYDAPNDDLAQLALECLLDGGERATVELYGMTATYEGVEMTEAMDAVVEAEPVREVAAC